MSIVNPGGLESHPELLAGGAEAAPHALKDNEKALGAAA